MTESSFSALKVGVIGLGVALLGSACSLGGLDSEVDGLAGVRFGQLQAAQSAQALEDWVSASRNLERQLAQHARTHSGSGCSSLDPSNAEPEPMPDFDPQAGEVELAADLDCVVVTGSRVMPEDIITNVQTTGIDEGGLFKRRGDHLLVLRGDQIFRVRIDGPAGPVLQLEQLVSLSDSGRVSGVWYDELLVFDEGAVVLSFDFDRAMSGLHLFRMDVDGYLTPTAHIEIQSEDYYSGSNYGMRLVGNRLLFQVSVGLGAGYRWQWPLWQSVGLLESGSEQDSWKPIIEAEDVLLPLIPVSDPVIHTVLQCDLDDLLLGRLDCAATGLIAEHWSELYVSPTAAYLAMDAWQEDAYFAGGFSPWSWRARQDMRYSDWVQTLIYRLPFDDDDVPGAVFVSGDRGNQFSFREVGNNLVVVSELQPGPDDRQLAVHQVPLSQFSDQLVAARFPSIKTQVLPVSHRHRTIRVADQHVLIGEHGLMVNDAAESVEHTELVILPLFEPGPHRVILDQSVDRIESLDDRFFISGSDAADRWAMTLLDPRALDRVANSVIEPHENAEARSHAFNWSRSSDGSLIMGLPGVLPDENQSEDYWHKSWLMSDFVFLLAQENKLTPVGVLDMQHTAAPGENCVDHFSCGDWYGNARLAFIGDRIFALSGNRLTEARLVNQQIHKVRDLLLN